MALTGGVAVCKHFPLLKEDWQCLW
jgi:hypothetical protein